MTKKKMSQVAMARKARRRARRADRQPVVINAAEVIPNLTLSTDRPSCNELPAHHIPRLTIQSLPVEVRQRIFAAFLDRDGAAAEIADFASQMVSNSSIRIDWPAEEIIHGYSSWICVLLRYFLGRKVATLILVCAGWREELRWVLDGYMRVTRMEREVEVANVNQVYWNCTRKGWKMQRPMFDWFRHMSTRTFPIWRSVCEYELWEDMVKVIEGFEKCADDAYPVRIVRQSLGEYIASDWARCYSRTQRRRLSEMTYSLKEHYMECRYSTAEEGIEPLSADLESWPKEHIVLMS